MLPLRLISKHFIDFKFRPQKLTPLVSVLCNRCLSNSSLKTYDIDLKINNTVPLKRYIDSLEKEYETLSNSQSQQNATRLLELESVMQVLRKRKSIVENINNLGELLKEKDKELQQMAREEVRDLEEKLKQTDEHLLQALLPVDENDNCNSVVLEVNAGVGGQEAMLFANELFEMYCNFAKYKGWNVTVADYETTEIGGIRHASAIIEGAAVFMFFKYEAGVHRVQRIPATEKGGRIHTSTASVIALPQPSDIEISIDPKDLRVETKRASGAGGQHVNTTDSAVRIVHIPTGITVDCQVDRSQIKNRKIAMAKLRAILYEQRLQSQIEQSEKTRKSQVRSNFRNEKIRTYNFGQDRISDHRLQGCNFHNIKEFLEGGEALESLISKLDFHLRMQKLLECVNNVNNMT